MKLSVSTFGWNNFSFADFVSVAREMRLDGIEIHDIGESRFTGVGAPFQKNEIDHTVRSLKALGLSITCLDARMNPAEADENGDKVQEEHTSEVRHRGFLQQFLWKHHRPKRDLFRRQ